ncbi:MAG: acetyl-CoA decarbonylase/synthase complex subunit gamma [Candidatus Bathyarchaeia archaeon]
MSHERVSPLSVYKYLPQTNCGECGEVSCMSFASKLIERNVTLERCAPLKEPKYKEKLLKLIELIAPPVKEVIIGIGNKAVKVGGKEVMYRHELTFHNPTAIAIDISDKMDDEKIIERCKLIEGFQVIRIGQQLKLDMVAVRCASQSIERFAQVASLVAKNSSLPMILCSFDPEALRVAVEQKSVLERKPLLYAVNEKNWKEVGMLAKQYGLPVTVFSPNDLSMMKSLVRTLRKMGIEDLLLDVGSFYEGKGLMDMVNNLVMIRRSAIQRGEKELGYPILAVPAVVWAEGKPEPMLSSYKEAYFASILLNRYADLIIMHTLDKWALLPVLTLRQCIYTDPRKPVSIEPGLRAIGKPDEKSPVLITSNFALTYYTVESDLEAGGVSCHLLALDTEGLAVEVSVAGGQFTAADVKDLISSSGVEDKVKHKKLIIPGLAARLKGDIEELTKWEVIVGPRDSSEIKSFLEKHWKLA